MITFRVDGIPRPKQSFKMGKHGGYTPADIKAWQNAVAAEAIKATDDVHDTSFRMLGFWSHPLAIELDFYLPDRRRRDLDNLSKAVLDAMNGIIYGDDCMVVDLHLRKFYDSPEYGVTVTVALAKKEG